MKKIHVSRGYTNFIYMVYNKQSNMYLYHKSRGFIRSETYKKSLESNPALLLYRRTYQKKVMTVYRNKENKQLKKDFDKWKKEAQEKIKLFKKGKLDEDTLYNWMIENK